jgi:hypothetical protein
MLKDRNAGYSDANLNINQNLGIFKNKTVSSCRQAPQGAKASKSSCLFC